MTCPLIVHLTAIRAVAIRTDPLIGHRSRRIEGLLLRFTAGRFRRSRYVRRHVRSLAGDIERLLRD